MNTYTTNYNDCISSTSEPIRHHSSNRIKWNRAKSIDRITEAYREIERRGGKTFTLRLDCGAMICVSGSADPARTMSRRIQRAFKRAGVPMPELAFILEVTADEREELHLHGAILLGNLDLALVKDVLRNAAGRIPGRAGSRQVQIKNFDWSKGGPDGWARYPTKAATRTKRVIDHTRLTYISQDLHRLARESWNECRGMQ